MLASRRGKTGDAPAHDERTHLLFELRELAEQAGLKIIHTRDTALLKGGASGTLKDQSIVVLDSQSAIQRRIGVLVRALRKLDWRNHYLKPGIRKLLEGGDDDET